MELIRIKIKYGIQKGIESSPQRDDTQIVIPNQDYQQFDIDHRYRSIN